MRTALRLVTTSSDVYRCPKARPLTGMPITRIRMRKFPYFQENPALGDGH